MFELVLGMPIIPREMVMMQALQPELIRKNNEFDR